MPCHEIFGGRDCTGTEGGMQVTYSMQKNTLCRGVDWTVHGQKSDCMEKSNSLG